MDIVRVRYFLAVCEHGSFTAAARVCGVSQPSVTTGVRRLERAIGGQLFERRHPVRLTPLGAELRPLLQSLQRAADRIAAAVQRKTRGAEAPADNPAGMLGRGANAAVDAIADLPDDILDEAPDLGPPPPGPAEISDRWTGLFRRSCAAIERSQGAIRIFDATWKGAPARGAGAESPKADLELADVTKPVPGRGTGA